MGKNVSLALIMFGVLFLLDMPSALADVLTLDRALKQAVEGSYDYKIAKLTAGISKTEIKIARSDYFPQIQGFANLERLRDLSGKQNNVAVVGNTALPEGTQYQNVGGLNINQTLWDFGQRSQRLKIAKSDVESKDLQAEQTIRDLKINVIDAYTNALITYQTLHTKILLVPIYQELFKMDQRLNKVGYISKEELSNDAMRLASTITERQELESQLEDQLYQLSEYTHMTYDTASTELSELEAEGINLEEEPAWVPEQSIEARVYNLEIKKKQHEVSLLKRQYLPQLAAYSYYNVYGSSVYGLGKSIQDVQSRSWTMGLNVTLPVFDGLRLQGQIEKAKLEAERLKMEREKRLYELSKKEKRFRLQKASDKPLLVNQKGWVDQVKEKVVAIEELSDEELNDKAQVVKKVIQGIEHDLAEYKAEVEKLSASKKLLILYTG